MNAGNDRLEMDLLSACEIYANAYTIQLPLDRLYEELDREELDVLPIDASFPEELATALARLESFNKHLYRPNSYLHKWWAQRSGTTFRHILKQLVDDPARRFLYTWRA
jgi:hypothetical protein